MNSFTEATNVNTQFAKKISLDEYNKQKDDYTQRALRELKEQLTSSSKRPLDNKYSDIELDDDSDSDSNSQDVENILNNEEVKEVCLGLWVLNSSFTNQNIQDVYSYAHTDDFTKAKKYISTVAL